MSELIETIRLRIMEGDYHLTRHAEIEARADGLIVFDVKSVAFTGRIVARYTRDPRGVRYKLAGNAEDGSPADFVCRLVSWQVRIITVFAM